MQRAVRVLIKGILIPEGKRDQGILLGNFKKKAQVPNSAILLGILVVINEEAGLGAGSVFSALVVSVNSTLGLADSTGNRDESSRLARLVVLFSRCRRLLELTLEAFSHRDWLRLRAFSRLGLLGLSFRVRFVARLEIHCRIRKAAGASAILVADRQTLAIDAIVEAGEQPKVLGLITNSLVLSLLRSNISTKLLVGLRELAIFKRVERE